MKEKSEDPNFAYSANNLNYDKPAQLGTETQSHLGRFPDSDGEKVVGNNYIAFSILIQDGGYVDYDSDLFSNESSAKIYLDSLNSNHDRKSILVPVAKRKEVETKIINQINTGTMNRDNEHPGALPKSADSPNGTPYYTESKLLKIKYLDEKFNKFNEMTADSIIGTPGSSPP